MSFTDKPAGERPRCKSCGLFRWAFDGYCLSSECAGSIHDPSYPLSMPDEARPVEEAEKPKTRRVSRKPPKKGRRALELQYEAQGSVAPWLEKDDRYA